MEFNKEMKLKGSKNTSKNTYIHQKLTDWSDRKYEDAEDLIKTNGCRDAAMQAKQNYYERKKYWEVINVMNDDNLLPKTRSAWFLTIIRFGINARNFEGGHFSSLWIKQGGNKEINGWNLSKSKQNYPYQKIWEIWTSKIGIGRFSFLLKNVWSGE